MKWSGPKNSYDLPGDPGFITRLFWAIEDWGIRITRSNKEVLALIIFAVALWLVLAWAVPGPH